jgi:transposase-like protein
MAKAKKRRKRYSDSQRTKVLEAAKKEKLTAADVQNRFGVTPVTYYSWRKKSGAGWRHRRPTRGGGKSRSDLLATTVKSSVQARMQALLPRLVQAEVSRYLDTALGTGKRGRRRS